VVVDCCTSCYRGGERAVFSTFEHPEPREGETIKVVFGTRDIKDANLVWFGNFRAVEIRKSAGGGGGKKG